MPWIDARMLSKRMVVVLSKDTVVALLLSTRSHLPWTLMFQTVTHPTSGEPLALQRRKRASRRRRQRVERSSGEAVCRNKI
jgi:hypothetical protein